jgi:hypothetical protein
MAFHAGPSEVHTLKYGSRGYWVDIAQLVKEV